MGSVTLEPVGRVAVITINRPERRNAIDAPTARALAAAIDDFDSDDEFGAGVLTGAGSTFCAGMDLKALRESLERPETASRGMFGIVGRPPEKPLIAAVEGAALGGGLEVALACDLIVASDGARFGTPEVMRGLVPAAGGLIRLPRRIPAAAALEMLLTGDPVDAVRAQSLGLVSRVTEAGAARTTAVEIAARIATNAPLAVRTAKQIVRDTAALSVDEAFVAQRDAVQRVRESADAAEGARAFAEKRNPVWVGH